MRALNREERNEFYSKLNDALSSCETFCEESRTAIVGTKGKTDEEFLSKVLLDAKNKKDYLLNLKVNALDTLEKNEIYTYSLDFYDYDRKLQKQLTSLNNLITCCEKRLNNIVPIQESMTQCECIRITFPSEEQVKQGICKLSGIDTYDEFLQAFKFKCTKQAILYHVKKKDLVIFLKEVQDLLPFVSSNIEYTQVQKEYRLFLSGSHKNMEREILELHNKYLLVKDKRDIADDHFGVQM